MFPPDLGPSGTAVLHVDRVRQGPEPGLWEEATVLCTLLPRLVQARWRWVDVPRRLEKGSPGAPRAGGWLSPQVPKNALPPSSQGLYPGLTGHF